MSNTAPDPSSPVVVSNPQTGEHETIQWSDLPAALAHGYTVPTDEEVSYEKRKESVDSAADTVAAGMESAVDWGIPFGKAIREEIGGTEYAGRSKAREEFHPVARGIGGVAGMGAMLLGTMGAGSGVKGAATAAEAAPELAAMGTEAATGIAAMGTEAGVASAAADGLAAGARIATAGSAARIGQVAAETTTALDAAAETSGIASLANKIAFDSVRAFSAPARAVGAIGRGIGGAPGMAAEGAIWGAGQEAGELTEQGQWDNPDLVAERLITGMGTGALLGAGMHGAGTLASKAAGKVIGKGSKLLERLLPDGATLDEQALTLQARAMDLTGQDAEKIAATQRLASSAEDRAYVARPVGSVLDEANKTMAEFTDKVSDAEQTFRKSFFRTFLDDKGLETSGKEFTMVHKTIVHDQALTSSEVMNLLNENLDDVAQLAGSTGELGAQAKGLAKSMKNSTDRTASLMAEITPALTEHADATRFEWAFLRNQLDSEKRILQKLGYSATSEPGAVLIAQRAADRYKILLERADLWGKAAADAQKDINTSMTNYLGMSKKFRSTFLEMTGHPSKVNDWWSEWGTDHNAVQNVTNSWLSPRSSNINAFKVATGYADALRNMFEAVEKHYAPTLARDADFAKVVREMIPMLKKWRPAVVELKDNLNLYGVVQSAKSGVPSILERAVKWGPAAVGGIIGGMPGASAGAVIGNVAAAAIHDPLAVYTNLAKIQRFTKNTGMPALTSIAGVVQGLTGRAKTLLEAATLPVAARVIALAHDTKPLRDGMRRVAPVQAAQGMSQHLAALAPYDQDLHARAATVAGKVYQHLYDNLPQTPNPSGLTPMLQDLRENPQDTRRWAKVLDVLDNPAKLSHYLANGTVIPEQITALRECYPATFALMQQHALKEVSLATKPVPFTHRASLGLVVGASDLGASYSVVAVTRSQSVYKPAAPQKSILNATKTRSEGVAPGGSGKALDSAT